ncbi:MAG: hypothetical protein ACREVY_11470 [Gammaproteobacteria bacterium]
MPTEADTCRWDGEPHSIAEQRTITDGRIVPVGKGFIPQTAEARRLPAALHARRLSKPHCMADDFGWEAITTIA